LSGSIDSSGGETGLFGGTIDGTVINGKDRPPELVKLIPADVFKKSSKPFKKSG
jgi:hypothetical protein